LVSNTIGLGRACAIGIYASFGALFLCYQMWHLIDDGETHVSPAKAVAGLLGPVLGTVWLFRVFPGFVLELNAYLRRHNLSTAKLESGWFIAFAIFTVVSFAPTFPGFGFILPYRP